MKLRLGYGLIHDFPQPTRVILNVSVHDSRAADDIARDDLVAELRAPIISSCALFGNYCCRILAHEGRLRLSTDAVILDSGRPDEVEPAVS